MLTPFHDTKPFEMEPVRPSYSKQPTHSPLHIRQRPLVRSPSSHEELKQMFEKKAEDLHCHLLKETQGQEVQKLQQREVELMKV
jgi:hypothetical protein